MTGQDTVFHDEGIDSVNGVSLDLEDQYFVLDVTFGDGNTGELHYPYRVSATSGEPVFETGTQGAAVKVPVIGEDKKGYRKRHIGVSSDVPMWVREKIKTIIQNDSSLSEQLKEEHNVREVKFAL